MIVIRDMISNTYRNNRVRHLKRTYCIIITKTKNIHDLENSSKNDLGEKLFGNCA